MSVSFEFTPEVCEHLHTTPKYVASRIRWKAKPNTTGIYIFRAEVFTTDTPPLSLDLVGHWQKVGRFNRTMWGFDLTYEGHLVRSYDMAAYHRNPGVPGKIWGPHKHKFTSRLPRFAYKPDPPISEDDANLGLLDFLNEANIELRVPYKHFSFE